MNDSRLDRAKTLRAISASAKRYADAIIASARAADVRAALGPNATRAKMTSANARWMRCAEDRDRLEAEFEKSIESLICGSNCGATCNCSLHVESPPPAGQPEASPLTWVNPAPHASAPMEPQRTANYPVGFRLDESRARAFLGQPEGVEALVAKWRDDAKNHDTYGRVICASMCDGHALELETRLASAQRAGKDGA